jgi:hypothetical protein
MPLNPPSSVCASICLAAVFSLLSPVVATAQEKPKYDQNKPVELLAVDPEIRGLLDEPRTSCDQININDTIAKIQKTLKIADDRGLIRDRALVEASLASAQIGQSEIELAFATFQKALQDAIDSKNGVLEADILISLASESQLKGNIPQATDLISKMNFATASSRPYGPGTTPKRKSRGPSRVATRRDGRGGNPYPSAMRSCAKCRCQRKSERNSTYRLARPTATGSRSRSFTPPSTATPPRLARSVKRSKAKARFEQKRKLRPSVSTFPGFQ